MTSYFMHRDSEVFCNPDAFVPERWFTNDSKLLIRMQKYYVPFSKGSRGCLAHK